MFLKVKQKKIKTKNECTFTLPSRSSSPLKGWRETGTSVQSRHAHELLFHYRIHIHAVYLIEHAYNQWPGLVYDITI